MMQKLGQTNSIEFVNLHDTAIAYIEKKEPYDIIYVQFKAFINEHYTHPVCKELNQRYNENFTEYWVFMRKSNPKTGDLYATNACPGCGSPLSENMGEISKCSACNGFQNFFFKKQP
ncbi:MAG TPA: hypothetical protein VD905_15670 [Flavobacteriales bacterium]|nr:hypothetical protein [Flavobacteriales bacterium]